MGFNFFRKLKITTIFLGKNMGDINLAFMLMEDKEDRIGLPGLKE
jgi:hypothetical protein